MSLRLALGWSSAQTATRLVVGFLSAKISATYLGPSGVALVGQLTSFLQIAQGSVVNPAGTGVTTLTAECCAKGDDSQPVWSTAAKLVWCLSLIASIAVLILARPIAAVTLGNSSYWPTIALCAIALIFAVTDNLLNSALNGLKQVGLLAKIGIASSVLEVSVFASLVYCFGLWGGLCGVTALYASKLIVSSTMAWHSGLIRLSFLNAPFSPVIARKLLSYYPMLIANSVALPLSQLVVRDTVMDRFGLETAGHLQALWRLSDMYTGVLTTALGMYFISHYSSLSDDVSRRGMLRKTIASIAGITASAVVGVYLLRDFVIQVVLTREFLPMGELMPFHLAGDVLKMACYPLQMVLVVQRRTRWYWVSAVGGPCIYVVATNLFATENGAAAAPLGYAISYLIVFAVLLVAHRNLMLGARSNLQ